MTEYIMNSLDIVMTNTLKLFTTSTLFDATSALLAKLNIRFNRQTAEPINVQ